MLHEQIFDTCLDLNDPLGWIFSSLSRISLYLELSDDDSDYKGPLTNQQALKVQPSVRGAS